jgi:hypothetical protein
MARHGGGPALRRRLVRVKELVDSASLVGDPESLRARLGVYGYLFFRGLLPTGPVTEAGAAVGAALAAGGWTHGSGLPSSPPRALNTADAVRDPAFRAATASRPFNRIPYLPMLRGLVRGLLGADAFSYPVKVLRAVYPEAGSGIPRGRYVHQDFPGAGVCDLLTTWVPLMPIPVRLGGLAVLPGSNLRAPERVRLLGTEEPGWATTDYGVGDVLLFHCLTSHAALPNRSTVLRLSQDSRWQPGGQPAPARMVYGPAGRDWELYSRLLRSEPWWEPLPSTLVVADDGQLPPGAPWSRFFAVHPGWANWTPRVQPAR